MAEICEVRTDEGSTRSLAVESEDPARVIAAVRSLGLDTRANVCMARGLKVLTGFGLVRHAVIDVGTNSVKLHVGERRADGTWSVVIDRAIVTRLGEGLDATGALGPEPMDRTLEAIAALADEARAAGAVAIAAVGTAGLRAAANAAEFVQRRRVSLRRPDRDHPRRGGGPPRLPRGHDGARAARRLARGLRHRRGQLPVHLRRRGRGRRAVQRAGRRGPPDRALRARSRRLRRAAPRRARADRRRARPPRRPPLARRARRDGRRADQPRRRRARTRGVRPGRRPRHPARPRRDRPADRALPDARPPRSGARSSACSPTAPRSSSRAPASCAWC